jgi:hypothetical protein
LNRFENKTKWPEQQIEKKIPQNWKGAKYLYGARTPNQPKRRLSTSNVKNTQKSVYEVPEKIIL